LRLLGLNCFRKSFLSAAVSRSSSSSTITRAALHSDQTPSTPPSAESVHDTTGKWSAQTTALIGAVIGAGLAAAIFRISGGNKRRQGKTSRGAR
jgi:hypothetical protein